MSVEVREHIASIQTEFQKIDIYDTECLGKMLFLDGHVQLATFDEFAYHESLVHIPLLSVAEPKRALVVGGGDGGVLRELVKHRSLLEIDLVDIDKGVIEASKKYLPELSDGAFNDPRVSVKIEDAFAFLKRVSTPYDLIVMDVTDVYEEEDGELSEKLFTQEFYADCFAALSERGFLVSQADNHVFCPYSMVDLLSELGSVFTKIGSFQALVPSFGGYSGYVWASRSAEVSSGFSSEKASALELRYLNSTTYAQAIEGGRPGGLFS